MKDFNIMRCVLLFLIAKTLIIRDKIILRYCKYLTNKNAKIIKEVEQRTEKITRYLEIVKCRNK